MTILKLTQGKERERAEAIKRMHHTTTVQRVLLYAKWA